MSDKKAAPKFISDDEMQALDAKLNPKFISDDEMTKLEASQERPWYAWSPDTQLRALVDSAPMAGGAIGGVLAGPPGAVSGAAMGKSLEQALEGWLYPEETAQKYDGENVAERTVQRLGDVAEEAAIEGVVGKAGDLVAASAKPAGELVTKAGQSVRNYFEDPGVRSAANALDIEVTPGMVTNSKFIEGLESQLEQTPSLATIGMPGKKERIHEALAKHIEALEPGVSRFEAGAQAKDGMIDSVQRGIDETSGLYNSLDDVLANTPVDYSKADDIAEGLIDSRVFRSSQGAKELADKLKEVEETNRTVLDLKESRSELRDELSNLSGVEYSRGKSIYDAITELRDRSLPEDALKTIREADKSLATQAKKLNELAPIVGKSKIKRPSEFKDLLENTSEEALVDRVFNARKLSRLKEFKDQFPGEFETLRQSKIQENLNKAKRNGKVSHKVFLNQFRKDFDANPEFMKKVYTPEQISTLTNMETVVSSLPDRKGPSGTYEAQAWSNMFGIKNNIYAGLNRALFETLGKAPQKTADKILTAGAGLQTKSLGETVGRLGGRSVADIYRSDKPEKPKEKTLMDLLEEIRANQPQNSTPQ